ncbi:MAG: hypothetical protein JO115_25165 [Pseudonocardiales bacterium]|nr:hypothetical protein [Pseudonocardiales bacterium]
MTTSTQEFAVIMAPADQEWWWYWGQTAEQVGQLLTQNKAMLTDISPYIDVNNTLKFAVIMAPANHEWWWYWGQTAEQVGQRLQANHARLTTLTPLPTIPSYTFSLDSFEIRNTRSRHVDTDYVTFAVTVGTGQPRTQTKSMGDLNNGVFSVGLTFEDVAVAAHEPVIVTYLIMNSGHQSQAETEATLENVAKQLADAGAKAAATAIASGVGTLVGATIGGVVVPVVGAALGALAGWLVSTLGGIIFADCDGPVAAQQTPFLGRALRSRTVSGPLRISTDNPGIDSPAGCGSNSDYIVNWSITRE